MRVLDLLTKEHALFRRLLDRLEIDLAHDEERARTELDDGLKTLLPALDRHLDIDDLVFTRPPDAPYDDGEPLAEIEEEHRAISSLREEILYALELSSEECTFERLRSLTMLLIDNLEERMQMEETRLWPLYKNALSRSLDRTLSNHLEKRVKVLEKEIERGIAAISMPF
ncbi:MAG TPA: hypothetical protein DCZ01_04700 [Elusimicrobia bacterium]|nr:hypothetical protein [Elusimicrobiota bacterium]